MADNTFEYPRRSSIDWGQMGQYAAQPFIQQQQQQQSLYHELLPVLFKAQIERQMQNELIDKFVQGGNGPQGNFDISVGPSGITYKQKSASEKATEQKATEAQGLSAVLPRFRKYALHEARGSPDVGTQRVEQLQGSLSSQFPTQMDIIKSAIGSLTPPKIPDIIKQTAYNAYQSGDRSPEILKALGLYISPIEALQAQAMGFGSSPQIPNVVKGKKGLPSGVTEADIQYTMKKHKLSRNEVLGRIR